MYLINKLVEYDPENKTLVNHISGRSIQLQLPANLCFLYLVTHPGEIISQNQLMIVGWGERNDVTTPNTFYQAILTLRNALAEVGLPRDTVKTISRRGLMLSEATQVERFIPGAEPVIANKDAVVADSTAVKSPAWLIITTATLLLIALINGGMLYKQHQNMPFSHYIPLSTGSSACQLFFAPNEPMQDHYLRLLNNNPGLCAEKRYVFLIGYSKTERIAAFACNKDPRRGRVLYHPLFLGTRAMMTLRNRIILLAAILVAVITSGWLAYWNLSSTPIRCTGNVEWTIGKNRFVGTVSWRMQHREGATIINGKLFGQTVSEVNRTIYFHYSYHQNARVLNNDRIVKTFADNADEADINATLPGFYRTPGRDLSLMIDEYRGAWLFAASNVPSLYCRKNAP